MTTMDSHLEGLPPRPLLALGLLVPVPTFGTLMAMVLAPGPVGQAVFLVCKAWILAFPLVWHLWVERGRPSLSPPRRGGFGAAVLTGAAIIAIMFAAYFLLGGHWIDAEHVARQAAKNGIGTRARYIAMALFWILINSLMEEYVWRWFVVRQCERLMRPSLAVVVSALLFTLHHVVALRVQFDWRVTILASLGVWCGGMTWSWLYVRYRSIWPCYVSHILADVPIFVIGWWLIFS